MITSLGLHPYKTVHVVTCLQCFTVLYACPQLSLTNPVIWITDYDFKFIYCNDWLDSQLWRVKIFIVTSRMSFRFSVTKQTHTEYKTINYTMTSTRRHQLDEVNSQNAERNGMFDFVHSNCQATQSSLVKMASATCHRWHHGTAQAEHVTAIQDPL